MKQSRSPTSKADGTLAKRGDISMIPKLIFVANHYLLEEKYPSPGPAVGD
jgi:hypothetical protein